MSDIDTAVADSLKVLDLKRPIREADSMLNLSSSGCDPIPTSPSQAGPGLTRMLPVIQPRQKHRALTRLKNTAAADQSISDRLRSGC